MPAMRWSEAVRRCREIGLSQAEMARRAGLSESTVVKGLKRDSQLRNPTRRVIEMVLEAAEVIGDVEDKAP